MRRAALLALRLALHVLAFLFCALRVIALGDVLYLSGLRELRPWQEERLAGGFPASAPQTAWTVQVRGDWHALSIPAAEQPRLRANPFHAYVVERILPAIAADLR